MKNKYTLSLYKIKLIAFYGISDLIKSYKIVIIRTTIWIIPFCVRACCQLGRQTYVDSKFFISIYSLFFILPKKFFYHILYND